MVDGERMSYAASCRKEAAASMPRLVSSRLAGERCRGDRTGSRRAPSALELAVEEVKRAVELGCDLDVSTSL